MKKKNKFSSFSFYRKVYYQSNLFQSKLEVKTVEHTHWINIGKLAKNKDFDTSLDVPWGDVPYIRCLGIAIFCLKSLD